MRRLGTEIAFDDLVKANALAAVELFDIGEEDDWSPLLLPAPILPGAV
ncbi:MAG: hypothetical protein P1V34_05235 [Alphaproteobacteria bacterium]|nr:hypothetical protein [Alphaproteobacteria bacterium]